MRHLLTILAVFLPALSWAQSPGLILDSGSQINRTDEGHIGFGAVNRDTAGSAGFAAKVTADRDTLRLYIDTAGAFLTVDSAKLHFVGAMVAVPGARDTGYVLTLIDTTTGQVQFRPAPGSSGGNGIFSSSNEGDTVRIERAYLRDSLIIDAQDNVVLFDSINAVDGFIIQASGYTGGTGSEARIRMSDRRFWFEQGSPQFVIDALDSVGLVGGALSFYRQGSLRHYWQLEKNNNLSYNGVGSALGGSDSTKLNFTGAFGARGFGLHIGFSPFAQQPSYLALETRGRQFSGTIYQGVRFSPLDSAERSRVGWILINSGAATAGTNADTLIDVGKGFRTDSIVSKGDLIVNTATGGIGYIDSIYTGDDTLLITGTTFSSGNGWQVYKVYGAYNTTQANLAPGTLVYYEPDSCYTFYNGTAWVSMCDTDLAGGAGASAATYWRGDGTWDTISVYAQIYLDDTVAAPPTVISKDTMLLNSTAWITWDGLGAGGNSEIITDELLGFTHANGVLTYEGSATRRFKVQASGSASVGATTEWRFGISINGSAPHEACRRFQYKVSSDGPQPFSCACIIELGEGDNIRFQGSKFAAGTDNLLLNALNLHIYSLD